MVLLAAPTFPGCSVEVRPIGVFWMRDEHGRDAKLLCVPVGDARWAEVHTVDDVPGHLLEEISHFFDIYKDLEPGKYADVAGWQGHAEAERELAASRARFAARDPFDATSA